MIDEIQPQRQPQLPGLKFVREADVSDTFEKYPSHRTTIGDEEVVVIGKKKPVDTPPGKRPVLYFKDQMAIFACSEKTHASSSYLAYNYLVGRNQAKYGDDALIRNEAVKILVESAGGPKTTFYVCAKGESDEGVRARKILTGLGISDDRLVFGLEEYRQAFDRYN